jgi:hypothetical protein
MPQLSAARAIAAAAVGSAAVVATWSLEAGRVLRIASNLGGDFCSIEPPRGDMLFESRPGVGEQAREGRLEGLSTVAFVEPAR